MKSKSLLQIFTFKTKQKKCIIEKKQIELPINLSRSIHIDNFHPKNSIEMKKKKNEENKILKRENFILNKIIESKNLFEKNTENKINFVPEDLSLTLRSNKEISILSKHKLIYSKQENPHSGDNENSFESNLKIYGQEDNFHNIKWNLNEKYVVYNVDKNFETKFEKQMSDIPQVIAIYCFIQNIGSENLNNFNISIYNAKGEISYILNN